MFRNSDGKTKKGVIVEIIQLFFLKEKKKKEKKEVPLPFKSKETISSSASFTNMTERQTGRWRLAEPENETAL